MTSQTIQKPDISQLEELLILDYNCKNLQTWKTGLFFFSAAVESAAETAAAAPFAAGVASDSLIVTLKKCKTSGPFQLKWRW